MSPQSLLELADSFATVANACGVAPRGTFLRNQFLRDLGKIHAAALCSSAPWRPCKAVPAVFVLEWVDPPFDAGHWVPEIIQVLPLLL